MTKFLKFTDKAEVIASGLIDSETKSGDTFTKDGMTVHVVGEITKQIDTGQINADGDKIYQSQVTSGYHVNVLGELPDELLQYNITVDTPYRVFAV